jgi:hypothetical protein
MLADRPQEQMVLFKEIMFKKMNVRDTEKAARRVAVDRIRKKEYLPDPELADLEDKLQEALGTRVNIDRRENGGQIIIDFFSNEDLRMIIDLMKSNQERNPTAMLDNFIAMKGGDILASSQPQESVIDTLTEDNAELIDDRTKEEIKQAEEDTDLYSIKNFSI